MNLYKNLELYLLLILLLACASYSCHGAIDESFLRKVEQIESGGSRLAIGDGNKSIGSLQFQFASWLDTSEFRASKGLKTYPYSMATNREIARAYAADYFTILELQIVAATGKKPSKKLLYSAFNLGFHGLKRRDFSISKLPATTKRNLTKL